MNAMALRVRPFRAEDAERLATIFFAAVRAVSRKDYSEEQLRAWAPEPPDPVRFIERAAGGRILLVGVDVADQPQAYGDLEPDGHIDHLYRHPDTSRSRAASLVYEGIERAARQRGLVRIYVEASEPAKRFLLSRGFVLVKRRDFEIRGMPIHNYAMEKLL